VAIPPIYIHQEFVEEDHAESVRSSMDLLFDISKQVLNYGSIDIINLKEFDNDFIIDDQQKNSFSVYLQSLMKRVKDINSDIFEFDCNTVGIFNLIKVNPGGSVFEPNKWFNYSGVLQHNKSIKLEFITSISSMCEYDGGEIYFVDGAGSLTEAIQTNSVIVYPSFVNRYSKTLNEGTQYLIYGNVLGPRWK
jgi:hypothetical protein